jgi:hypothetical protein
MLRAELFMRLLSLPPVENGLLYIFKSGFPEIEATRQGI